MDICLAQLCYVFCRCQRCRVSFHLRYHVPTFSHFHSSNSFRYENKNTSWQAENTVLRKRLMHNMYLGVHKNFLDVRNPPKTTKQYNLLCIQSDRAHSVFYKMFVSIMPSASQARTRNSNKMNETKWRRRISKDTNRHRFCFGFHKRLTLCFTASILMMRRQYSIE